LKQKTIGRQTVVNNVQSPQYDGQEFYYQIFNYNYMIISNLN